MPLRRQRTPHFATIKWIALHAGEAQHRYETRTKSQEGVVHLIVALIMGGVIGWIAGMVMRTEGGIIWNVLIGCLGSILGRFLLGAFSHDGHLTQHPFDPRTLIVAFVGAVVLLAIYNLAKRGTVR